MERAAKLLDTIIQEMVQQVFIEEASEEARVIIGHRCWGIKVYFQVRRRCDDSKYLNDVNC